MEYDCNIVNANKVYTDFNKVVRPLCSGCSNTACSNPIAEKKLSVFGKIHTGRFFFSGDMYFIVTSCEGYRGIDSDSEENEDIDEGEW
jgi:hypothetical protein